MKGIIERIAWTSTMISLACIAMISPRLIEYILENYPSAEIRTWWSTRVED